MPPVSYTHLDVYKRQGKDWMPAHGLAMNIALQPDAFAREDISYEQAINYLRKDNSLLAQIADGLLAARCV